MTILFSFKLKIYNTYLKLTCILGKLDDHAVSSSSTAITRTHNTHTALYLPEPTDLTLINEQPPSYSAAILAYPTADPTPSATAPAVPSHPQQQYGGTSEASPSQYYSVRPLQKRRNLITCII